MRVNVVNGFSEHPEGGNPAGVVYLNEELCLKETEPASGLRRGKAGASD